MYTCVERRQLSCQSTLYVSPLYGCKLWESEEISRQDYIRCMALVIVVQNPPFLFFLFSSPPKKETFSNPWQPNLSRDFVHLRTCGKSCGMFQMIPRCGPQTGLTPSFLATAGGEILTGLSREKVSAISKNLRNLYRPSLRVTYLLFLSYFQSMGACWSVVECNLLYG